MICRRRQLGDYETPSLIRQWSRSKNADRDGWIAWYYVKKYRLLTTYMEKGESLLKFTRRRTDRKSLVRIFGATMDIDTSAYEELYLLVAGIWYVLRGRNCPDHTMHTVTELWEGRSTGIFVLGSRSEAIFLRVHFIVHKYLHYATDGINKLVELLLLEKCEFERSAHSPSTSTCSMYSIASIAFTVCATAPT